MKGPKIPLVEVTWDDAHALDPTKDRTLDDIHEEHTPYKSVTVGWAMLHDKVGISVAAEYQENREVPGTFSFRGITFIPAGMIRSVKPRRGARLARKGSK